jgi:hypothetical protein
VRPPQGCDARVYRDVYPPRIDLEFRLTDGAGRVVRADKRVLRDSNYLTRSALAPSDPLRPASLDPSPLGADPSRPGG